MDAVMDIIENLIQHDLLENSAISLKNSTPKRAFVEKPQEFKNGNKNTY